MSNKRRQEKTRGGRKPRALKPQPTEPGEVQQDEGGDTSKDPVNEPGSTIGEGERQRGPGGGRIRRKGPRRSSSLESTSRFRIPSLAWWSLGGVAIAAIVVVVALLQGASSGANTGDHWHAALTMEVCDDNPFSLPSFPGEIHSHGDGQVHLHPSTASQAGNNASLGTFFKNAAASVPGFSISAEHITIDGEDFRNGDLCGDGRPGQLVVKVNGSLENKFLEYLPQDYDVIDIRFR